MLGLSDKDFKLADINVFKIPKETILWPAQKKKKEPIEKHENNVSPNINKEMEIIKRNQIKNSGI